MSKATDVGIWMDHLSAHITEFTVDPMKTTIIHSRFTHEVKEQTLHRSENIMHNKEQHEELEYYKEIGNIIKNYEEVILFGPTEAKSELFNILSHDSHFSKIKIEIKQTDKMTENQQHAFVRKHFESHPSDTV
jgi:hypothetical protein